jgi:hypothetical protein
LRVKPLPKIFSLLRATAVFLRIRVTLKVRIPLKLTRVEHLLFGRKHKLKVDMTELHSEMDSLSSFLSSNLKVEVTANTNELQVSSENLSSPELKRTVRKFVYHRKLNNTYWVALENGEVKIHRFKSTKKPKKHKKGETPNMFPHGF